MVKAFKMRVKAIEIMEKAMVKVMNTMAITASKVNKAIRAFKAEAFKVMVNIIKAMSKTFKVLVKSVKTMVKDKVCHGVGLQGHGHGH